MRPMNQPAKAPEPSMEEILASIRRIIADDDAGKPAKAPEAVRPAPAPVPQPVASPPPAPAPTAPAAMSQDDIDAMLSGFDAPPPPPAPAPAYDFEPPRPAPPIAEALLSSGTRAAVDAAFNSLAHTVLVQNARTLEDLVREMLRPMLKSWLDDNLPTLVERLVRAEIERV